MADDVYMDLDDFVRGLTAEQAGRLAGARILFCYPVMKRNAFELEEHPVSQRILVSVMTALGCDVATEFARVAPGHMEFSEESRSFMADAVIIHPMIGSLPLLPELARAYRRRFPNALLVLQNSDQHQHEKLIGGPDGGAIAEQLRESIPEVDWIIVGFAEHALASLMAGRPTAAALGRHGNGAEPMRYFRFSSLPEPIRPLRGDIRDRSIRAQRARGCLSGCTYCIEGQANRTLKAERPWDGLPMDAFVDRLSRLAEEGYFFINVTDSTFEDPGRKGITDLIRFAELVVAHRLALSFKIHLRAETVLKLSDDDLDLLKRAGVDVLVIGLESGSDEELTFYHKIANTVVARQAVSRLDQFGRFCTIYGYMMFAPISTAEILRQKVSFLRDIGRGWDFLNLTNQLLVFWGTVMHRQLVERGVVESGEGTAGYVDYRFADAMVEELAAKFNALKKERSGFAKLNNAIYDALNLESRFLNPANSRYLDLAGADFDRFRTDLAARCRRLNALYCDGFERMLDDPNSQFLAEFDPDGEADEQARQTAQCLSFVGAMTEPPTTLYFHTWLSVVNTSGVEA